MNLDSPTKCNQRKHHQLAVFMVENAKDRITVALCTNATGTDKIKPLVIAKARRPRCFRKNFYPNLLVDYKHNSKAWMTTYEFLEFFKQLNRKMASKNRHIVF